jgi:hypothetical protein
MIPPEFNANSPQRFARYNLTRNNKVATTNSTGDRRMLHRNDALGKQSLHCALISLPGGAFVPMSPVFHHPLAGDHDVPDRVAAVFRENDIG